MEDFVVDRTSWHFKMVEYFNAGFNYPKDFCSYWRIFILGMIYIAVAVSLIIAALSAFAYGVYTQPLAVLGGFACIVGIFGAAIGVAYAIECVKERRRTAAFDTTVQPGILQTKYRSWKDRICPRVTYK